MSESITFDYLKMGGAYMHEEERELIKRLSEDVAARFDPCIIVQIGVAWGGSLYCSRAGAPGATIYGVDIFGDDTLGGTDEHKAELALQVIRGDSSKVWAQFNRPIHFLYIDGNHSYEGVSADIRFWGVKVVSGGYMALHDCAGCEVAPNINRALQDHASASEWEYLGIEAWSKYFRRR